MATGIFVKILPIGVGGYAAAYIKSSCGDEFSRFQEQCTTGKDATAVRSFFGISAASAPMRKKTQRCKCPGKYKLNDGNDIPAFGLGTWLGTEGGESGDVQKAVEHAITCNYRHFDTASVYGVEEKVGSAITKKLADGKLKRCQIFVTTKLWNDAHAKKQVIPELKKSLERLGLTFVDLYLIHWPVSFKEDGTADNIDLSETWKGMIEARKRGLAKSIGVSNFNEKQIAKIIQDTGVKPAVNQVEINLNLNQPELVSYCKSEDIVVVGYTPFGSLFPEKAEKNAPPPRIDDPDLTKIAEKYKKTVPQITLRYLLQLGVVPIPKSVTISRIEENIDIFDFELTEDEMKLIKKFDKKFRTIPQTDWKTFPNYPFV